MVYKKYVRKGGRLHGPYYYESYREGDTVKKRYLGTSLPGRKRVVLPIILIVLGVLLLIGFFYVSITGKIVGVESIFLDALGIESSS